MQRIKAPSNKALHLTKGARSGRFAADHLEAPFAGEGRCYPGGMVWRLVGALAGVLMSLVATAAMRSPFTARLEGPHSVVLGEPLNLSLLLRATSRMPVVATLPHLSIEREAGESQRGAWMEVPCEDLEGTLSAVPRGDTVTLPTKIHIGRSRDAQGRTGESDVAFAFPAAGRYRIRAWAEGFEAMPQLPDKVAPSAAEAREQWAALKPIAVMAPPFVVDVLRPPPGDLTIFEQHIRPHPGVFLGRACWNPDDRRRAEAIERSFPRSRYVKLLIGNQPW